MRAKRLSATQASMLTEVLENGAWTSGKVYMNPFWWVGDADSSSFAIYRGGNTVKSLVRNGFVSISRIESSPFKLRIALTQKGIDALAEYRGRRGEA